MDFFKSQESLTTVEWIFRGMFSFVFLLVVAKTMGQRSISQLRTLDFIMALILGNIIAHPLSDESLGLRGSLITTIVLVLLYISATWLSLKWPLFKRYLDPSPVILVKNGLIQFRNLSKARISMDFLFSELRKEKVEDIQKVSLAIWEPGGTISVFIDSQHQPLTPADMKMETRPITITRPIVIDGKIDMSLLQEMGKDIEWLNAKIALSSNGKIRDVILATVNDNEQVQVYAKNSRN